MSCVAWSTLYAELIIRVRFAVPVIEAIEPYVARLCIIALRVFACHTVCIGVLC